jgi:hypothetical protein
VGSIGPSDESAGWRSDGLFQNVSPSSWNVRSEAFAPISSLTSGEVWGNFRGSRRFAGSDFPDHRFPAPTSGL